MRQRFPLMRCKPAQKKKRLRQRQAEVVQDSVKVAEESAAAACVFIGLAEPQQHVLAQMLQPWSYGHIIKVLRILLIEFALDA